MSGELAGFLRARYDEDEEEAEFLHDESCSLLRYPDRAGCNCDRLRRRRALDDVIAHRGIVAACPEDPDSYEGSEYDDGYYDLARLVLRLLALPYVEHPDYRQEWKP